MLWALANIIATDWGRKMGAKTLVSIGMSCQTRFQLSNFAKSRSDHNICCQSSPFDWLICPPKSVIDLLDAGMPIPKQKDLTVNKERAYWPEFDVYY